MPLIRSAYLLMCFAIISVLMHFFIKYFNNAPTMLGRGAPVPVAHVNAFCELIPTFQDGVATCDGAQCKIRHHRGHLTEISKEWIFVEVRRFRGSVLIEMTLLWPLTAVLTDVPVCCFVHQALLSVGNTNPSEAIEVCANWDYPCILVNQLASPGDMLPLCISSSGNITQMNIVAQMIKIQNDKKIIIKSLYENCRISLGSVRGYVISDWTNSWRSLISKNQRICNYLVYFGPNRFQLVNLGVTVPR